MHIALRSQHIAISGALSQSQSDPQRSVHLEKERTVQPQPNRARQRHGYADSSIRDDLDIKRQLVWQNLKDVQ